MCRQLTTLAVGGKGDLRGCGLAFIYVGLALTYTYTRVETSSIKIGRPSRALNFGHKFPLFPKRWALILLPTFNTL